MRTHQTDAYSEKDTPHQTRDPRPPTSRDEAMGTPACALKGGIQPNRGARTVPKRSHGVYPSHSRHLLTRLPSSPGPPPRLPSNCARTPAPVASPPCVPVAAARPHRAGGGHPQDSTWTRQTPLGWPTEGGGTTEAGGLVRAQGPGGWAAAARRQRPLLHLSRVTVVLYRLAWVHRRHGRRVKIWPVWKVLFSPSQPVPWKAHTSVPV